MKLIWFCWTFVANEPNPLAFAFALFLNEIHVFPSPWPHDPKAACVATNDITPATRVLLYDCSYDVILFIVV